MSIALCLMFIPSHAWAATSSWSSYTGGQPSGAVTQALTPVNDVELSWSRSLGQNLYAGVSDLIMVDEDVVVASGDMLYRFDSVKGAKKAFVQLAYPIGYGSRLLFAQNTIFVPLSQGRVQAFNADTLESLWVSDALPQQQNLSTPLVFQDMVLIATCDADASGTYSGFLRALDMATGQEVWTYDNDSKGFYWAGAVVAGDYAIIGDDAGVLHSFSSSGEEVTRLALPLSEKGLVTPIRSTLITNEKQDVIFVVTTDGTLHKVHVSSDGNLQVDGSVNFGTSSTSTPVYVDGSVFVCGESHDGEEMPWGSIKHYGLIACIDAETMTVMQAIDRLDTGEPLTAEAKSTPLVSVQDGNVYTYFTVNDMPGSVYRYRVGDSAATSIYEPEGMQAQYCLGSVIPSLDGMLYYTNDSKTLFALSACQCDDNDLSDSQSPIIPDFSDDSQVDNAPGISAGEGSVNEATPNQQYGDMNHSATYASSTQSETISDVEKTECAGSKTTSQATLEKADDRISTAIDSSSEESVGDYGDAQNTESATAAYVVWAIVGIIAGIAVFLLCLLWLLRLKK